ncbi:MAG: 50S ribosomal protein L19 [Candidatus Moeniiplasma glomeromycotorum]|nr:50S ribosomal protein L19 [Candidatus Moeniiplasma glomeromycotorum]MCE8167100.1 50S ribosomal protein L19 [Candidatus Moeniiplasma glomeromycotorum]MCE8168888.1 50S ribosomal protein L19 [Candidatus Moeniiplasma glomeromycotorum]
METKISKNWTVPASIPLELEKQNFRTDLPKLQVGEEVKVTLQRSREIKKEGRGSNSTFVIGEVIALKNPQRISYTFTLLGESDKVAFTAKFLYHSPLILKIEKLTSVKRKIRKAKNYDLVRRLAHKKSN